MNAPTGRNSSVSVSESALAAPALPKSLLVATARTWRCHPDDIIAPGSGRTSGPDGQARLDNGFVVAAHDVELATEMAQPLADAGETAADRRLMARQCIAQPKRHRSVDDDLHHETALRFQQI